MKTLRVLTAGVAMVLVAVSVQAQPTLTGMIVFSADGSGNASLGQIWNTLGGDGIWNLYVINGPSGGPFVNTGNSGAASISIPLALGTNTFTVHGDYSGVGFQHVGLNLFFGSDTTVPKISAFAATGVAGATANGGTTYRLDGGTVTGVNQLTYGTGIYRVTLSNLLFTPNVTASDRVDQQNNAANGVNDNVLSMTLEVEIAPAVPALSAAATAALALLLAATGLIALRRLG